MRLSRVAEAGRRGSPEQIVEGIRSLDSDVVFLPEAYDGEKPIEPEILHRLERELGYTAVSAQYNDCGDRQFSIANDPHMMLLSRVGFERVEERRFGDVRGSIVADIADKDSGQTIRILGIHLDDREEEIRLQQVEELIPCVVDSPYPVVVMGDFNAMYSSSVPARFLKNTMVSGSIDLLSRLDVENVGFVNDILKRLSEMAIGETLRQIERETNLVAADPRRRHTMTPKMRGMEWMPSVRLVQIDHMLTSPDIRVNEFRVGPDYGSDHRSISADVRL